jgi:hypothetical protein
MGNKYWGEVQEDWAGFSADKRAVLPYFDKKEISIFLGEEFDEDGEEIENPPSNKKLTDYEIAFRLFEEKFETLFIEIKRKMFERYCKLYAKYYEDSTKSGEEPLNITDEDKHFEYMKEINLIRVLDNGVIKIQIFYKLDEEHGVEIKIKNNKVSEIGGISETN